MRELMNHIKKLTGWSLKMDKKKNNILVIGTGKVSSVIARNTYFSGATFVGRRLCDITNEGDIRTTLDSFRPSVVINCAGMTDLERCQEEKAAAYLTNTVGPAKLLAECSRRSIKLVHISSGCLFDGNEEVSNEDTRPSPSVWYTYTKMWADEFIAQFGYEDYLILRPRQMISSVSHPTNMITKFLDLGEISAIDEPNSVTCIEDFVDMIVHLLETNATGIYNCANSGFVTPLDVALGIQRHIDTDYRVEKISYPELLEMLPNRRVNTLLSIDKLIETGFIPRSAPDALEWCLRNYACLR
jgi:dTDP-4-dehydrorhamnose reductase